jgi:two-component system chemotaxis response regulator CheY
MKFVIVDDEEVNLVIARKLLQHALGEVDISTFTSGGETLRYLKNNFDNAPQHINLFLDLNMSAVSGWDFLEFFNQFEDEIKSWVHIYIVTSSIDPRDKRRALLNSNVIAYFSKPLTTTSLIEYFGGRRK